MSTSTVACIVVAAGRGDRLRAGRPKAFVDVGGRTPVEHVARTVVSGTVVDHLVVVVPADMVGEARQIVDRSGAAADDTAVSVVAGGATRQESVAAGIAVLADSDDIVLVHDAARCLTPGAVYDRVVEAIRTGEAAVVPVLPIVDTVKRVADDVVTGTVDRSCLYAVQTPQGFRRGVLATAHEVAMRNGDDAVTDDAGLVERLGMPVHVVNGDDRSLKITRPFDLDVASALVRAEGEGSL